GDLREARHKVIAIACEQLDAVSIPPRYDTEPIVFDFMNPAVSRGRRNGPSRKARVQRDGALNAAPLGERRHAWGIDRWAGRVERRNASSQGLDYRPPIRRRFRWRKGG